MKLSRLRTAGIVFALLLIPASTNGFAQSWTPVVPATSVPDSSEASVTASASSPAVEGSSSTTLDESNASAASASASRKNISADALPHNLSPIGMFLAADWIVKGVMIGLGLASILTWTIALAKLFELGGARGRAKRALQLVSGVSSLDAARIAIGDRRGVGALMVKAAAEEKQLTEPALAHASGDGLKERVSSRLHRIELAAGRNLMRGTGILATIGSIGPFVGLFGTVWGIMNAFVGISAAQTTNLAVVAPGIAEALLATAIGLVAAIPAVVFYNVFARAITGYRQLLADISAAIERLVSRDLDFRGLPQASAATGGR